MNSERIVCDSDLFIVSWHVLGEADKNHEADSLAPTPLLQIQSLAIVLLQVLYWNLSVGTEESCELGYGGSVGTMT
jgi:hypothetical protein